MADIIQTVKDANGKDIDINISKICDINGDFGSATTSIKDSAMKNRISFQHDVQLVDSKGNILDATKLLSDASSGKTEIVALDVDMEATHSGKNHNHCIYYEDSMEKDSESFMNPFHKPMLKNHDDCCEPIGRITQSYAGPSQLTDERSAIHLRARVTDKDAIPKFIDKRYGTVSIGGSMGTVTCNICGKTILKDGKFHFCGHWRGETYKDQVCYWGARDIEYHEVSVVNNPADDFAQIMKVTVLTDKDINQDHKEENSMGGSDSTEKNVDDIIDQTLGSTPEVQDSTDATVEDQNQEPSAGSEDAGTTTDATGTPEDTTSVEDETSTDGTPNTTETDARIAELEKELEDAKAKIETLETEAIDAQSQIQTLTQTIEDSKAEAESYKQRCVALATANKESIVDGIIAKETFETEDAKASRKKDLMIKSMKELKAMTSDAQPAAQVQRTTASVTSPCLAVEDNIEGNGSADADKKPDNRIVTVDDAAQDIIKRLFK